MSTVIERAPRTAPVRTAEDGRGRDLLEILFLVTVFLAPMHLSVFRALTAYDISAAALAFLTLAGPTRMRWIPSSLRIAGLLLLLAGLFSAFRATYPLEAFNQVLQYGFSLFILLPVVLTLVRSRSTLRAALMMFILGYLVVVGVSALIQETRIAGRALPFFQETNANALAVPTIFLMPFVLHFILDEWRSRRRGWVLLGGGAALYLMLWALTASGSRGSTGATIISVGLFLAWRYERGFSRRVLARIVVTFVALAALGGVLYWTGFFHFRYVAQSYDDGAAFRDPPNLWIQFLAQAGLVAAAAVVFIFARWFMLMFQARSLARTRSDRELLMAFIAAMVGVTAHTMFSPVLVGRFYWLLYGLGMVAAALIARSEAPSDEGSRLLSSSTRKTRT
jgi:O-antigen ligase